MSELLFIQYLFPCIFVNEFRLSKKEIEQQDQITFML
jgi:hypothetical protein